MTSPLNCRGNQPGRSSRSCSKPPSCSRSWSCSHSSSRSYDNPHVAQDDRKPSALLKRGYLYSFKSDDGRHIHRPDKSDSIFATFSAPMAKKSKHTQEQGIAPAENLCVPPYVLISDRELEFLTDSHIKLDILADTQEPFKNSYHNKAFDYDEDTVSLVVEQTLSTSEISLSNNFNSSAEIASTAFEYECYEIEDDTP